MDKKEVTALSEMILQIVDTRKKLSKLDRLRDAAAFDFDRCQEIEQEIKTLEESLRKLGRLIRKYGLDLI